MLIITHAGCSDGSLAAYILDKCIGPCTILPCNYGPEREELGERLPQLAEEHGHIYITDFSFKREHLLPVLDKVTVFDHHKTAQAELEGLANCHFDMDRSGCKIVWDYCAERFNMWEIFGKFFPHVKLLCFYVQDRDLWKWKLDETERVTDCLRLYGHDWDKIIADFASGTFDRYADGVARMKRVEIDSAKKKAFFIDLHGSSGVPCINYTGQWVSEVLHELAKEYGLAASWFHTGERFVYSLRSVGDIDVSVIAKHYGGGGHKNAAGFNLKEML